MKLIDNNSKDTIRIAMVILEQEIMGQFYNQVHHIRILDHGPFKHLLVLHEPSISNNLVVKLMSATWEWAILDQSPYCEQ
jgi:hypothetical protein